MFGGQPWQSRFEGTHLQPLAVKQRGFNAETNKPKTSKTPPAVIATCKYRLNRYRAITQPKDKS
jgi:hypothetical protein